MSKNIKQGIQSGKKDQSADAQKTGFMSLNGDVLACIAAFLNVKDKMAMVSVSKHTATDALSHPHAWDGMMDFFPMQIHHIDKALAIMPQRTWVKKVKLTGCRFNLYSTYFIKKLVVKCPMLQHLDLSCSGMITDSVLDQLAGMPLQHLNLWGCDTITDAGLQHLAGMPLQHLNLDGCDKITDAGLQHLAGMPLQRLDLSGFWITDAGLQHLAGMPLQHLYLSGCRITQDGLKNFPNLARAVKF